MTVTDVEVSRALNAVVTTLNDQRPPRPERQRVQAIVTGALGGEEHLVVGLDAGGDRAQLTDRDGRTLARVQRRPDGRWVGERVGAPLRGASIPGDDAPADPPVSGP